MCDCLFFFILSAIRDIAMGVLPVNPIKYYASFSRFSTFSLFNMSGYLFKCGLLCAITTNNGDIFTAKLSKDI